MHQLFQIRYEATEVRQRSRYVSAESEEEAVARWKSWNEEAPATVKVLSVERVSEEGE